MHQRKFPLAPLPSGLSASHHLIWVAQVLALGVSCGGHDQADDQAVESQGLSEDKDQDHANEEARLLSVGTDTSISDDTDGQASSKGAHPNSKPSPKVCVTRV